MGTRYYIISTLIILAISLAIGFLTQKKQPKEIAIIYLWTTLGALIVAGLVYGFAKVLIILGIAEGGFTV
jgi:hypothetical protein